LPEKFQSINLAVVFISIREPHNAPLPPPVFHRPPLINNTGQGGSGGHKYLFARISNVWVLDCSLFFFFSLSLSLCLSLTLSLSLSLSLSLGAPCSVSLTLSL